MSFSLGIYGGSFDPVHKGHLRSAGFMCRELGLDKMMIIPAAMSPFKTTSNSSSDDRLSMCRLAFSDGIYEVSPMEIERGGKSYTVDTVEAVSAMYPDADIYMSVGSDQLLQFAYWYRYRDILSKVTLCSVSREKDSLKARMEDYADRYLRPWGKCLIFDFDPLVISSSEIRDAVKAGKDINEYVPPEVVSYIEKKGLYK